MKFNHKAAQKKSLFSDSMLSSSIQGFSYSTEQYFQSPILISLTLVKTGNFPLKAMKLHLKAG